MTTAAMLAICLLALVETTNTAEATSLPENGRIAFSSNYSSIYTVEPDGSNPRQLTHGPYQDTGPIWSPDGTKIYFSRQRSTGTVDALVMSADGSNLRVPYPADESFTTSYPAWSPDGSKVAFISNDDVYMMDADGSDQTKLTNTPTQSEMSPNFSPNGSQMCFSRRNLAGAPSPTSGIYVMDVDGSDPTMLVRYDSQSDTSTGCDWSPDGTKIAFHAQPIKVEDLDKSDIRGYSLRKATTKMSEEVYVINADGSGLTSLTSNPATDVDPDWSPDGTKITFSSTRDGGDYDIYTMDADGSNVTQVTENTDVDDMYADWQPLPRPTKVKPEKQQEERQPKQTPKNRSVTGHLKDTGGPSLLLLASALLFSGCVMFYAAVKRGM